MGVVYKALQLSLRRTVAVKMILNGRLAGPADVERFLTEAEAAANLRHPNIVSIHEVGEQDGQHYFSMDYVDGPHLGEYQQAHPFTPEAAARLVKTIAEAVHHAHQRGTLHRDLKPQNVLMDAAGDPHITDFGLAKLTERESGLTESGAVMGSPSYMPPEQAAGRRAEIGPPSDVYALGAILYQLLTGRPPFARETPMETLNAVVHETVEPPRKANPGLPRDLETICLKCLEKQPARRYFSARDLVDELARFLNHEPILARPAGTVRRGWNWAQRNPWALAAAFGCVALTMVCLAYGFWQRTQFLHSRLEAGQAPARTSAAAMGRFGALEGTPHGDAPSRAAEPAGFDTGPKTPALRFFLLLPALASILFLAERNFRKDQRAWGRGMGPASVRRLALHGAVGMIAAAVGMGYLLVQIRFWAWAPWQGALAYLEFAAVACVLALNWIGLRMVWEAAGIHESSRFRDTVEKAIERDLAAESQAWPVLKRVGLVLWVMAVGGGGGRRRGVSVAG